MSKGTTSDSHNQHLATDIKSVNLARFGPERQHGDRRSGNPVGPDGAIPIGGGGSNIGGADYRLDQSGPLDLRKGSLKG